MDKPVREARDRTMPGVARGLAATMPIVLAGTMAMTTLNLGPGPLAHRVKATTARQNRARLAPVQPSMTIASDVRQDASANAPVETASVVPSTYVVRVDDSVSEIATRYGLSTASVLALNGLSWKSLIFPGQVLRLSAAKAHTPTQSSPPAPAASATTSPVSRQMSATPAPARVSSSVPRHYTILRGDTVTAIARRFGVSVHAILAANQLVASSIIYAGRTLVIPRTGNQGGSAAAPEAKAPPAHKQPTHTQPAEVGSGTVRLSASMAANARVIISVGRSLGVPAYGIVIALATAAQESTLENLSYGDRDSVGLFQQRPSAGWGTVAQLTNPAHASELFYGGPKNPNKGRTRGLLDIPGWQNMTLTRAAQAVQVSGAPDAYAKWEASARAWLSDLG